VTEHRFGGDWTETKLACLRSYLLQYRHIFRQNERARFFKTWFVDAFAGTGSRVDTAAQNEALTLFHDVYGDLDAGNYREGSASIALSLDDPFDNYLFIEKSAARMHTLKENLSKAHPHRMTRCSFEMGDANDVIKRWSAVRNWKRERAVVFLDPYGMQVEWRTIELLGQTKAVDLWYLFPLGVGVSRLLTRHGDMEESWKARLDTLFGTPEWRQAFYGASRIWPLFPEQEQIPERTATPESIESFLHKRLESCFEGVARGLVLKNSRSNPMYLLCFAAANKRGAPVALRIAQHILAE